MTEKDAHSFSPATFINKGVRHDSMRNLRVKTKNVTLEQWDEEETPASRESPAQLFLCLVCDIRTEMLVSLLPMIFPYVRHTKCIRL